MKKASKILLTIGGVFNILAAVSVLICGFIFGIMAFFGAGFIFQYLGAYMSEAGGMGEGAGVDPDVIVGIICGILCIIGSIVAFILLLVSGVIAIKAPKAHVKGKYIACIVWGVLTDNIFHLVGAILGLIALGKEGNQTAQPQPEPAPAPLPEPAPAPAPAPATAPVEEPKPAPAPARKDWFCPNCGAHNEGKFCAACGTKKPE